MKKFEKYYGWIIAFVFCVAVIAVYKTFDNFSDITKYVAEILGAIRPFFIAFIIAYILNIPSRRLQTKLADSKYKFLKEHSLGISICTVYVFAIVVVLVILRMLIPALYKNVTDLYNNLPDYMALFRNYINDIELLKKLNLSDNGFDLYNELNKIFMSIDMTQFGKYAQGVFDVTSGLFDIFVAVIASIYMLIDKERLQSGIYRIMGIFLTEKKANSLKEHAKRTNDIFTNYLYSRLMCSVIMAIVCSIVLMIMNVKYALVLGIFIGAMDMIPYFGSIISVVISILVTFVTGGFWQGVWTGVVLLILQQVDGNLLGPRIMSNSLEIRPLWIIFAVTFGGALFGFAGMLFSVPIFAVIRAVSADYILVLEHKKKNAEAKNDD